MHSIACTNPGQASANKSAGREGVMTKGNLVQILKIVLPCGLVLLCSLVPLGRLSAEALRKDIRALSQHFLDAGGKTAPWIFVPQENLASLSTSEHPGVVTIWEAGRGKDIKGILEKPIRIDDYPLPWDFHLGLVQNYQAMKGISEGQINYAIGLNLVVTFSDPATGPKIARGCRPGREACSFSSCTSATWARTIVKVCRRSKPHLSTSSIRRRRPISSTAAATSRRKSPATGR